MKTTYVWNKERNRLEEKKDEKVRIQLPEFKPDLFQVYMEKLEKSLFRAMTKLDKD